MDNVWTGASRQDRLEAQSPSALDQTSLVSSRNEDHPRLSPGVIFDTWAGSTYLNWKNTLSEVEPSWNSTNM